MDYFDILKRALTITWRYKALWVLGFFAAAGSGSSGGGGGGGGTGGGSGVRYEYSGHELDPARDWAVDNLGLLVALGLVVLLVVVVFFVLSIAARGGLVYAVNEAEEMREVRLADGWRTGFRYWGRTFGISLVLGLPILLFVLALLVVAAAMVIGVIGSQDAAGGLFASILAGICGIGVVILVMIPVVVVLGILIELAIRHGVIQDMTLGNAIKAAWADLWGKKGVFVMWLVMLLPAFAYGMVVGVAAVAILVPGILMGFTGAWPLLVLVILAVTALVVVANSAYSTFVSASWTVFFRRMEGIRREIPVREPRVAIPESPVPPEVAGGASRLEEPGV